MATAKQEFSRIKERLDELRALGDDIEEDEKLEKSRLYEEEHQMVFVPTHSALEVVADKAINIVTDSKTSNLSAFTCYR